MAKVIFSFYGKETHIQCLKEDKMKDICNKFSSKININLNFLYFLYNGNQINLELTFKEQVNSFDNNRNQMNILVFKHENDGLKCQKCGGNISLPILDNILQYNKNQKDILIEIKNQIENIISLNEVNNIIRKIKLMKIVLDNLITENEKNQKEIENILNNNANIINNINKINYTNTLNIKQNYNNSEIIYNSFDSNEQKIIESFIDKCNFNTSDYGVICNLIWEQCNDFQEGKWTVVVGEKNKFIIANREIKALVKNIGPYKLVISYLD